MIKVLIKEPDTIYHYGLQQVVIEHFKRYFSRSVVFITEFTPQSVQQADIIILGLCKGEPFLCIPELVNRKSRGVIGLINDPPGDRSALPFCLSEMAFISRQAPLADFRRALLNAWPGEQDKLESRLNRPCSKCPHKTLTYRQTKVLAHLCNGKSVPEIACELMLKPKNVYAHKYLAMQKFELRGDYEMLALVSAMLANSSQMTLISQFYTDKSRQNTA